MTDQELAPDWLDALRKAETEIPQIQDRVMKTVKDRGHAQAMADALTVAEHCVLTERRRIEAQIDEAAEVIDDLLAAAPADERHETWLRLRALLRCPPPVIRGVEDRLGLGGKAVANNGENA